MKLNNIWHNKPIKIGACYILFIFAAIALCFYVAGVREIVSYASKSKPYATIFSQGAFGWDAVQFETNETKRDPVHDKQKPATILLIGDSNLFFPPLGENNELGPLLEEALRRRGESFAPRVSQWGFLGATMLDYYFMFSWVAESPPDIVVVPVNWRSFCPEWFENEDFTHPELSGLVPLLQWLPPDQMDPLEYLGISKIKQLEYRFSLYSVYGIGIKNWLRFRTNQILNRLMGVEVAEEEPFDSFFPDVQEDDKEERELTVHTGDPEKLRSFFPMDIPASHPILRAFSSLSYIASRRQTKLLFFIWPLDKEHLDDSGALDERALENSLELIAAAADKENVRLVDLSGLLEHKYFFDALGHCQIKGRTRIADALAVEIVRVLEKDSGPGPDARTQ